MVCGSVNKLVALCDDGGLRFREGLQTEVVQDSATGRIRRRVNFEGGKEENLEEEEDEEEEEEEEEGNDEDDKLEDGERQMED